ncbi:MAG TPA: glycosyltransferase family 2 protein [Thermoanaerobaculia bacterium]|nr:glycosyltransferase family 2 protein [Thermoanaerobaculia bacterium]
MRLLTLIVLAAWVLAFFRTVVNLALIPRLKRDARPAREPLVSIVIPARDEARVIERTVRAFLAQTYANFELIVVNDRSTDATGAILRSIEDDRLVVIDGEEPPAGWLGKPWALHQGSRRASGEILLFVDADVIYAPNALRAAVAAFEHRQPALLTLLPFFEMRGFGENASMPMLAMTCFSFLPTWLSNRTRGVALAIGGGTGNLVRRDAYDAAGGHEALKDSVVDDVGLARLIRRAGGLTTVVRGDDLISLRMYHGLREVIEGFTKNSFAVFGRNYLVAFLVAAGCVVFHILPFVLALTGDRISIDTVVVITLTRLTLFRSLRYRLDNALLLHPVMCAIWLWIFVRSTWLTGVRRKLLWRGRTYDARHTRFGAERR